MAFAITGREALPPNPPDPRNNARTDFPPLRTNQRNQTHKHGTAGAFTRFTRYLEINFGNSDRRHINPYKIVEDIVKATGEKPRELTGSSKSKLTLQTRSADQTSKCLNITTLGGEQCQIRPHPFHNTTKGMIRLRQYDIEDMEEFRERLLDQYDIQSIEKATFIRCRPGESAYIITFNEEMVPYSVYVPGEVADTVVQPFGTRPMQCKQCQEYGHTAKHCRSLDPRCRKCAEVGHQEKDCTADTAKCHHCNEAHVAGFPQCPKHKEEQLVLDIVQKQKVTYQRARQQINEKPITRTNTSATTPRFPSLFDITMPKGTKRRTNPWFVEKCIRDLTGKMPRSCRGKPGTEDTFTVEVSSAEEARLINTMQVIGLHKVDVQRNDTHNVQKALIYIQGYDLVDFDEYKIGLQSQYGIVSVEHAQWIKTRNNRAQALLLGFQGEMPNYLDIPGESMKTPVHEYKRLPNLCKKCLEYGHSQRVCRETAEKCINCTSEEHKFPPCDLVPRCCHCTQTHRTGDKNCQRFKVEQEVIAIQARSRVSRNQAYIIYNREHPNANTNYAAAVAVPISYKKPTFQKPPIPNTNSKEETVHLDQSTPTKTTPEQCTSGNQFHALVSHNDEEPNVSKLKEKYENEFLKRKAKSPAEREENQKKKSKCDESEPTEGKFKNFSRSLSRNYRRHEDDKKDKSVHRRSRSRSKRSREESNRDLSESRSRYSKIDGRNRSETEKDLGNELDKRGRSRRTESTSNLKDK